MLSTRPRCILRRIRLVRGYRRGPSHDEIIEFEAARANQLAANRARIADLKAKGLALPGQREKVAAVAEQQRRS